MILDCAEIQRIVHALPLVRDCDVVRNGSVRMSTSFTYPNGDHIDVFLESKSDNLFSDLSLSDYGYTSLYLRSAQTAMDSNPKKKEILASILSQLQVKLVGSDLVIDIPKSGNSDISEAVFRLSQACLRISDFAAHQKLRTDNPFRDEVEGFIQSTGLLYLLDQKPKGRYGNRVPVDFEVFGREESSYVCTLSALSVASAKSSATETFKKWHDLSNSNRKRVTIYDSHFPFKNPDLSRLRENSTLIAFPSERETLKSVLAA